MFGSQDKIKGKFLAEKRPDNDNFIYLGDPNWKNSSMSYAHGLRDADDNVVTSQELVDLSVAFEDSLHILRNGRDE